MSQLLKDFAAFARDRDWSVTGTYSGRGMFGRQCFGMVGSESPLNTLLEFIADEMESRACADDGDAAKIRMDEKDFSEILDFMRLMQNTMEWDSMGRKTVFYWPDIDFESPNEDEEDTDYDD